MTDEIWKYVHTGADYMVSNHGRVLGLKRNKILKPATTSGRPYVWLYHNSVGELWGVHVLVCWAFNGPKPFPEALCCHRDDTPSHNTPDNLYWGTYKSNTDDAIRNRSKNQSVVHNFDP